MIISPMRNLITSTVAGFLFNLPLMSSVIIVYEKVSCLYLVIQKLIFDSFFICYSIHKIWTSTQTLWYRS